MTPCPLTASWSRRPAECYRLREDERGLGSDAPSPLGSSRAREAPTQTQSIEIVCTTAPLKSDGFPIRDAFQPVGSPWRALGRCLGAMRARFSLRRPFARRALPLRASPAYPTSSRNRKWSRRTDAAYRLLQPSESMSTPRERLFLAQNPLFRRILLGRNFCSDASERHGFRS